MAMLWRLIKGALKAYMLLVLLGLLIGSGSCVVFDAAQLWGADNGSDQATFLLLVVVSLFVAGGAGYGMYAIIRSWRRPAAAAGEQASEPVKDEAP